MAQYRTLMTFPPAATAVAHHRALALLHADGAVVWQTAADEIVESRDAWAAPPEGPDPATLTATPVDPEAVGWRRLTPAP
jgi:hypothetical protein